MATITADYVVVGAGAIGMAFTDALIADADVSVALVDRRHAPGGQWLEAYPFVRLHQASAFYGVASTLLGGGRVQQHGPERGLHERATAAEILAYYETVLTERLLASGRVTYLPGCEWTGDGRCVSRISGEWHEVRGPARIVDAHYLSPRIPAESMPPFAVDVGARVIPVGEVVRVADAPSEYVVVGSGKTATDACIWLLQRGVDPDRICWVRPRDPWMLDRARIQPDPQVFIGAAADVMEVAATAETVDDVFLGLEERGVLLRIDTRVMPTMAKTPTLARWELELLRSVEHVVRLGHVLAVERGRLVCTEGKVPIAPDAVVVHCAGAGLPQRPLVPIWRPEVITLQPIRTGFPCFGAALAGHAEATITGDADKNRLCPPSPYSDDPIDWLAMQVIGARAGAAFTSDPDLKAWADTVALNPARSPADLAGTPAMQEVLGRLRAHVGPALTRMAALSGVT
ncbi:pyridine nucleotide-disulfide oxidoreductase [Janibacter terrae]|uniref:pyridine nucleotide-disulfide oxidoreductase n=1 Tax=Janibacter terrae TaxID=103817 RepID=UPI00380644EF